MLDGVVLAATRGGPTSPGRVRSGILSCSQASCSGVNGVTGRAPPAVDVAAAWEVVVVVVGVAINGAGCNQFA